MSTFYSDIETTVLNNGYATDWIKPSTGERQGCPLSPFLFMLSADLMSNKIRQSNDITGISLFSKEIKLSQFADDTNLLCADLESVENSLRSVNSFGDISGLRLNIERTKATGLGKWENRTTKPLSLKWVKNPTKILGIYFSYDIKGNNQLNFDHKIQKLQTNLDMWRSRDLTLFGRVLTIKTLGISNLVYSASNFDVPKEITKNVQSRLLNFYGKTKGIRLKE